MHLLQGGPTTLAVLANLNVSAMEAGVDAADFCDQLLDGNMEDMWLNLLNDDNLEGCLDVDMASVDESPSSVCTPVTTPRLTSTANAFSFQDTRAMNIGFCTQTTQVHRTQPAAAAASAVQNLLLNQVPSFHYPPAFQAKFEPTFEAKPHPIPRQMLSLSTHHPPAPTVTPPLRQPKTVPPPLPRPVMPTGLIMPPYASTFNHNTLSAVDLFAAQRVHQTGPSPFDLLPTPHFNAFNPMQNSMAMQMAGYDYEGNELYRERNKQVHNVLERKRRRDLNDTFDALNTAVHVTKERKVVPSKACKREILSDAIDKVQALKARQRKLNVERDHLAEENRMLLARLRELQARA